MSGRSQQQKVKKAIKGPDKKSKQPVTKRNDTVNVVPFPGGKSNRWFLLPQKTCWVLVIPVLAFAICYAALYAYSPVQNSSMQTGICGSGLTAILTFTVILALSAYQAWKTRNKLELMRHEQERNRDLLGTLAEWIWETDDQLRFSFTNPNVDKILGYSPDELIERKMTDLMSQAEAKRVKLIVLPNIRKRKQISDLECTIKHKDGRKLVMEVTGKPYFDVQGRYLGYRGASLEITKRKDAQMALRESNAMMVDAFESEKRISMQLEATMEQLELEKSKAEQASDAKSSFLANMSHEIRTPMTAILGFIDILAELETNGPHSPERLDAIETIKRNGEYLIKLINDILDLSKIEAGKMEVEQIPCCPFELVENVQSLIRVRSDTKGLIFESEFIGSIPETIMTDPTRLRQVLINLLGNAIKFTKAGTVRLVTRLASDANGRNLLQFDVIDSGIGMTEEQATRLFDPFVQADTSTTRNFGGTGLGLTISRRLARSLGGDIKIEYTKPNKGTCFRFTCDIGSLRSTRLLAPNHRPASAAKATETPNDALPDIKLDCNILLAEDGPDNQRLISFILKKAGAQVTIVDNGKLAVNKTVSSTKGDSPFDLILMDMQMPIMDGYQATARLRSLGLDTPIVALTANAMEGDREKCISVGCNEYTTKPIDRIELIKTINKAIMEKQSIGTVAS